MLKVVDTTGMLRDNARAQRLTGEVVAENRDGTIKIATEGGDITVQKPAHRPDLILGAKVEIDVPPGRPPRQITVKDSAPPPPRPSSSEPVPSQTAREETPPVITAPPRPPVAIPEQPPLPPVTTNPAPVTPEQIVRLLPLTPEQAAQIIPPPAEILDVILPGLPLAPVAAAQLIAAAAPEILLQEMAKTILALPATTTQAAATQWQGATPSLPATLLYMPATPAPVTAPSSIQDMVQFLLSAPPALATDVTAKPQAALQLAAAAPAQAGFTPAPNALYPAPFLPAPATRAFMMATPENFIQTATPSPAVPYAAPVIAGPVMPKMDAQIVRISAPVVKITSPQQMPMPASPFAPVANNPVIAGTPGMLQAEVLGITAQQQPVLAIHFPAQNIIQNFVMQFTADNLQPAASVTILPQPGSIMPAFAALPTPLPELFSPGLWPAFDDMFQALQQAAPQTAQFIAQSVMPNASSPARMPAVMMMFIAAIKGGDMQGWLGEKTIDTLRRIGKAETITRITRDGTTLSRVANTEPAGAQDWRSLPLPMIAENHVYKIFLHYRHDNEKQKDGPDKTTGTRFILDIHPHRMGDVQLDGLHRPPESGNRLDLIVRTKDNLSAPMQQSMRRLYVKALESADMAGELSFQNTNGAWVRIKTNP